MRTFIFASLLMGCFMIGNSDVNAGDVWPQSHRGDRNVGAQLATRSQVIARNGMAATSIPLATQVALDILKQGGSAAY